MWLVLETYFVVSCYDFVFGLWLCAEVDFVCAVLIVGCVHVIGFL